MDIAEIKEVRQWKTFKDFRQFSENRESKFRSIFGQSESETDSPQNRKTCFTILYGSEFILKSLSLTGMYVYIFIHVTAKSGDSYEKFMRFIIAPWNNMKASQSIILQKQMHD